VPTLQIEHPISDFEVWKRAFDADPVRRKEFGVRRYRVLRPVDDPQFVTIDLEFETIEEATAFRGALERLWNSGRAARALAGTPRTRIVEQAFAEEL
jgi:hypothetical protein